MTKPFWEIKALTEMNREEWESLCDGCAKCCLVKLEDAETNEVYFTDLACKLLNKCSCQCSDYANRIQRIPDCLQLTPQNIDDIYWLPTACAYRLINENKPLPAWHPLVSGDNESVHKAGNSVRGRVLSEQHVHPEEMEEHIIHWVN